MRWKAVHQFVPSFARGDAIGDHVAFIRDHLQSNGCDSEIFVGTANKDTSAETVDLEDVDRYVRSTAETLLLYHVAQASPCVPVLLKRTVEGARSTCRFGGEIELRHMRQRVQRSDAQSVRQYR